MSSPTDRPRHAAPSALALAIGLTLSAGALAACNIVGPLGYLVVGPAKIKKVHDLDSARPTVVLVENGRGMNLSERTLRQIADAATDVLLRERVLKTAISPQAAYAAAASETLTRSAPIVEIGRKAQAEVVIYVTVGGFALSPDGATFDPVATMSARVFDAVAPNDDGTQGRRVWPDEGAHEFTARGMQQRQGTPPRDSAAIRQAESELAQRAGLAIAQLFHDVVPENASDARLR